MGIISVLQMRMLRLRVVESVSYASQKGEAGLKLKSPDTMQIFFLLEAGKCLQVISEQILCPAPHPPSAPLPWAAGTVTGLG